MCSPSKIGCIIQDLVGSYRSLLCRESSEWTIVYWNLIGRCARRCHSSIEENEVAYRALRFSGSSCIKVSSPFIWPKVSFEILWRNKNILTWYVYTIVPDESVVILFWRRFGFNLVKWKSGNTYVPVLPENVPGLGDCCQEETGEYTKEGSLSWKVEVTSGSFSFPISPSK